MRIEHFSSFIKVKLLMQLNILLDQLRVEDFLVAALANEQDLVLENRSKFRKPDYHTVN